MSLSATNTMRQKKKEADRFGIAQILRGRPLDPHEWVRSKGLIQWWVPKMKTNFHVKWSYCLSHSTEDIKHIPNTDDTKATVLKPTLQPHGFVVHGVWKYRREIVKVKCFPSFARGQPILKDKAVFSTISISKIFLSHITVLIYQLLNKVQQQPLLDHWPDSST